MRVFAVSDVHLDYDENARWLSGLSTSDYREDILILAGDASDSLDLLDSCFHCLTSRFRKVLFVPGNHELWVTRDGRHATSMAKFESVCAVVARYDVSMQPFHCGSLSIVPLLAWYDYTFGPPHRDLQAAWTDYRACRWPGDASVYDVASHFLDVNESALQTRNTTVMSFSHFLPRIDVMPAEVPIDKRLLYPILGTTRLETQIRRLCPTVHVYGHSHLNRRVTIDGVCYINNAYGYPSETRIAAKRLMCVYGD